MIDYELRPLDIRKKHFSIRTLALNLLTFGLFGFITVFVLLNIVENNPLVLYGSDGSYYVLEKKDRIPQHNKYSINTAGLNTNLLDELKEYNTKVLEELKDTPLISVPTSTPTPIAASKILWSTDMWFNDANRLTFTLSSKCYLSNSYPNNIIADPEIKDITFTFRDYKGRIKTRISKNEDGDTCINITKKE